jgi:uncharacterized phage protein (TIGR01671 family)
MREIKFRAWDEEKQKYIPNVIMNMHGDTFHYDFDKKDYFGCDVIIEQYTGLKDENGVEIYEGDILLSQAYTDKPHSQKAKSKRFHVVVKWDNKNAKFYSCRNNIDIYRYGQWGDFFDVRIVGNIHENKELLK